MMPRVNGPAIFGVRPGSLVLGFFNRDSTVQNVLFNKFRYLGFRSKLRVRDLWRQRDLADLLDPSKDPFALIIPAHG